MQVERDTERDWARAQGERESGRDWWRGQVERDFERDWARAQVDWERDRDWWRAQVERETERDWARAQAERCVDRRVRRRGDGSSRRGRWVVFQNEVVTVRSSTQEGGACRIPQRVLCGGRVPLEPAATFHGILRESAAGRLAWCLRVPTGSPPQFPPSTDVIVGDVSGGGGCPGERDSLCESLGKRKFEAWILCDGKPGAADFFRPGLSVSRSAL